MSDPGALAASLLQKNFSKFGSFRVKCNYQKVGNSVYTPSNGNASPVIESVQAGVYFIFADFTYTQTMNAQQQKDDEKILDIDKNAIVPALDLKTIPSVGDLITDDQGIVWRVMGRGSDPKPAVYQLHVRPVSSA